GLSSALAVFFSSRRRHTRSKRDWSSDVCSSDLGESGSGKSQTSFSVLGLLPTGGRVVSGSIHFEGVDLVAGSSREHGAVRGKKIAYIPQEPMSNLDPM